MRALGGFLRAITRPQYRQVFRSAMGSVPKDYFRHIGYGIYGGRKIVNSKQKTVNGKRADSSN
jgi:hypothetical protein